MKLTCMYDFGDVVLLTFPFTDMAQKKKRPALVLWDTDDNDILLCRITSKAAATEYDFKINEWNNCGLMLPSVIRLHKIATLEKSLIERKLGKLNTTELEKLKKRIEKLINKIIIG